MGEGIQEIVIGHARRAKAASLVSRSFPTDVKNAALHAMADSIIAQAPAILAANAEDCARLGVDVSTAFRRRIELDEKKIQALAASVRAVAALPDPVGAIVSMTRRPNGLRVGKIRIPIGVICCIYESRPSVTVDIAALALKSGNACILRGGKEALATNTALASILATAASRAGAPADFLQFVTAMDHAAVPALAAQDQYIDLIIPRGGEALVDAISAHARMPVLRHRKGVTHLFVDASTSLADARRVIVNAKVSNPSACNSLEKALIHSAVATAFLPALVADLAAAGVEVRGCARSCTIAPTIIPATDADWSREYLDLIITVKIVDSFDEAVTHIQTYSTGLADGILTADYGNAWRFLSAIDSAATFVNASTRFTDGGEFGLGAEVGINTSKIHGMGPMGLEELTVTKYIVFGDGQIRT